MTSKGRPRSREFDMRPNLNTTQFSQGTLFSGGSRSGRMHRGYSPERLADVRAAVNVHGPTTPGVGLDPYPKAKSKAAKREGLGGRAATEQIARSTAPMSDMPAGLPVVVQHPDSQLGMRRGAEGQYHFGVVQVTEGAKPGTLLHELGHAASGATPRTDAEQGREEAHADDYSMKHARGRTGGRQNSRFHPARSQEFQSAYVGARQEANDKVPVSNNRAANRIRNDNPALPGLETAGGFNPRVNLHPAVRRWHNEQAQALNQDAAADRRSWRRNG